MHPTVFQWRAFGQFRVPAGETAAMVRHLATGCGACRAKAAPWLMPWLDEMPAAEARATDAARCGPALAAEYGRAARRVARAAARRRVEDAATADDRDMQRVLMLLDREGPAAIGQLPRRLLGRPAVAALLRQIERRGHEHPRLRLRLAEVAWDLAASQGMAGRAPAPPGLAVRAGIELANAYRVASDLHGAREMLDRMADRLASRRADWLLAGRFHEVRAAINHETTRRTPAAPAAARAAQIYRRCGDADSLARTQVVWLRALVLAGELAGLRAMAADGLRLADAERNRLVHQAAVLAAYQVETLLGALASARDVARDFAAVFESIRTGQAAVARHRLEGDFHAIAGNGEGALRSYLAARQCSQKAGLRHHEAVILVQAAAIQERQGDLPRAEALACEAADLILARCPHHELHTAAMFLRLRQRFKSLRHTLPLERVATYLDLAEFDGELRLDSFLA